jgi:biotin carboxyl carrier protein
VRHEIEAGGRVRLVTVSGTGDSFAFGVDGRPHHVDAVRIDAHTLSLIVDSGAVYTTTVAPEAVTGRLIVQVGAVPVAVTVNGSRRRRTHGGSAPGSGPLRIVAPMPGKVVRVLVKAGDAVQARQPVVVVEAMKMENELRADRDGTVAELHTREGASVEAGALLAVIQ